MIVVDDSYLTEACSHGFQCLYKNVAGALQSMSNFWRLIASTYKEHANILGSISDYFDQIFNLLILAMK